MNSKGDERGELVAPDWQEKGGAPATAWLARQPLAASSLPHLPGLPDPVGEAPSPPSPPEESEGSHSGPPSHSSHPAHTPNPPQALITAKQMAAEKEQLSRYFKAIGSLSQQLLEDVRGDILLLVEQIVHALCQQEANISRLYSQGIINQALANLFEQRPLTLRASPLDSQLLSGILARAQGGAEFSLQLDPKLEPGKFELVAGNYKLTTSVTERLGSIMAALRGETC